MKTWDELYADKTFHPPKYPEPVVVRWVIEELKHGARVLDLGCGSGRHLRMLNTEGFAPYGCDAHSDPSWYNFRRCSASSLPYGDGMFDAVLCWGVLYYLPIEECKEAFDEIYRVLHPGGKALIMVKAPGDRREAGACIPQAEHGMELLFLSEQDIRGFTEKFLFCKLEVATQTLVNQSFTERDYHVYLTK